MRSPTTITTSPQLRRTCAPQFVERVTKQDVCGLIALLNSSDPSPEFLAQANIIGICTFFFFVTLVC